MLFHPTKTNHHSLLLISCIMYYFGVCRSGGSWIFYFIFSFIKKSAQQLYLDISNNVTASILHSYVERCNRHQLWLGTTWQNWKLKTQDLITAQCPFPAVFCYNIEEMDKFYFLHIVRTTTSNGRLNKRTKIKDNEHTIFVNVVRSMVPTSVTIEQL